MNGLTNRLGAWLLWLLPFALVALVLGWETDWGRRLAERPVPPTPPQPQSMTQPVGVALLPDFTLASGVEARRETVDRTLFNPTRRPAPTPAQVAAKPTIQRGQFVLTGTVVVDNKAVAFLREVNGGKARSARKGDVINGLTVADVKPDRVRFAVGDESEELLLKVAAGPRQTVQPAVPQPPQAGVPSQPGGQPGQSVPPGPAVGGQPAAAPADAGSDPSKTLLERRRAARAAAAEAQAPTTTPTPASGIPVLQNPAVPTQPAQAPTAAGAPDPRWAEVYQRMRRDSPGRP